MSPNEHTICLIIGSPSREDCFRFDFDFIFSRGQSIATHAISSEWWKKILQKMTKVHFQNMSKNHRLVKPEMLTSGGRKRKRPPGGIPSCARALLLFFIATSGDCQPRSIHFRNILLIYSWEQIPSQMLHADLIASLKMAGFKFKPKHFVGYHLSPRYPQHCISIISRSCPHKVMYNKIMTTNSDLIIQNQCRSKIKSFQ